jgi:eukaryotic-like serine/threonine-protein kinase
MGSVWRAEHVELKTSLAIKLMDPAILKHPEGLARFRREAQAAASLHSPNVVQVFDYGIDEDVPFLAMELLEGESLSERLARLVRLSPEATVAILADVARAVTKAHQQGIVHRDLKPDNIFLVRDDDRDIGKILDFGIAKRVNPESAGSNSQTQAGAVLGSPNYMSPEQALGRKDIDYRTDIWSFGIIAFECVTGRLPFHSESLGEQVIAICTGDFPVPSRVAEVPAGFDAWFARCAARDPAERYPSVREAFEALRSVCAGRTQPDTSISVKTAPVAGQTAKDPQHPELGGFAESPSSVATASRRRRRLVVSAAVIVIAGALAARIGLLRARGAPSRVATKMSVPAATMAAAVSAGARADTATAPRASSTVGRPAQDDAAGPSGAAAERPAIEQVAAPSRRRPARTPASSAPEAGRVARPNPNTSPPASRTPAVHERPVDLAF